MFWQNWYKSSTELTGKFVELEASHILATAERLRVRIEERFPGSGLSGVACECRRMGEEVQSLLERLKRPIWPLRILTGITVALLVIVVVVLIVVLVTQPFGVESSADLVTTGESGVNDLIFLAIALWFIVTLESQAKRRAVLKSLHHLRSLAHVVDMHQLTKDPSTLLRSAEATASSPKRPMSPYLLTRYLDYCSELVSLISKLAALHAQKESDAVVLRAVTDVESLSAALAAKIWQKVSMLDKALPQAAAQPEKNQPVPAG